MSVSLQIPGLPSSLKSIGHYLKTSNEHENRDPVVAYWCRLYALECGMKLDRKSKEALAVLLPLMDWLEKEKKVLQNNEAIVNEVVASAHVENYAIKLFNWADNEDRASKFSKNLVKAFYTSGMLLDVMTVFGELTPENAQMRKYAKWKAAYLHNCLRNGETPVPGPAANQGEDFEADSANPESQSEETMSRYTDNQSTVSKTTVLQEVDTNEAKVTDHASVDNVCHDPSSSELSPEQVAKAKKYCKFVSSALDYDDKATAINYVEKALNLLKFGHE